MIMFGVSITVVVVIVVGIWIARKVDGDSANFLVAGRSLGVPLVSASLVGAAVDANATVGNTDLTSQFGFWSGASLALGLAICLTLTGTFLAKPMNAMKLFTLADYFRLRFSRTTEVLSSVIMIFSFVILLAGNLVACGFLMERFAGMPYAVGILVSLALVFAYTVAGGLFSDAYTAMIQTVITIVAAISLLWWVATTYGIIIPEGMGPFDLGQLTDPAQGSAINWATLFALGVGDIVAIDFMQRVFGAKNPQTARRACYSSAVITATVGVIFALVALAGVSAGFTADDGPILYAMLGDAAPPIIAIFVLSGIIAASFSTASGAMLATSAIAVRNIAGVRRTAEHDHDPLLRWTRLIMVPISLAGAFLAIQVAQTGILLTLAFDLMLVCLAGPFITSVFWKRPGVRAMLISAVVGLVVRMTFLALTPTLYGVENNILYIPNDLITADFDGWATLLAFVISYGVFLLVAWLSPRSEAEYADYARVRSALDEEQVGMDTQAMRIITAPREEVPHRAERAADAVLDVTVAAEEAEAPLAADKP
ncbi:MAG: sodium:solute symporter family protein [Microbacterium sp.]